ncbi:MAG: twin-arginine translocation signal domain-containing protein [Afipia sp.]
MTDSTRRAFLGLAQKAVAAAAVGVVAVHFTDIAEAMPVVPDPGKTDALSGSSTQVQWHPPHRHPGWRRHPRHRRRWVCWWHRGRRICGWRRW